MTADSVTRLAEFSPSREYRYTLTRDFNVDLFDQQNPRRCLFVCLNPSTADETVDDPTVTRIMGFARRWGYTTVTVCNLFALRATNPRALYAHPNPVSGRNDDYIAARASRANLVVAAWGAHGDYLGRGDEVLGMLLRLGPVFCLGMTQGGQPKHPLYLRTDTEPRQMKAVAA